MPILRLREDLASETSGTANATVTRYGVVSYHKEHKRYLANTACIDRRMLHVFATPLFAQLSLKNRF